MTDQELLAKCLPYLRQQAKKMGIAMLVNGEDKPSRATIELVELIEEVERRGKP